nr:EOG090X0D2W [Scapholeberis mucronata]
MDPNTGEKKYGLIIPSKNKGARGFLSGMAEPKRPNKIFTDNQSSDENLEESDEEEETGKPFLDWRSKALSKTAEKSMQRNQARQAALKALEEDPTVFQYDEVYDEMQQKKEDKKPPKEEKKPKYIANLLKTAELRKVETERRVERKVQKERETEGDMFNDKEAFVTPAYRAKLAELKKLEEEERLRELQEANLDVTKQRDLSGFYRHLYKQTFSDDQPKKEAEEVVTFSKKEPMESEFKSRRQYRSRKEEEEESEEEEEEQQQPKDTAEDSQEAQEEEDGPVDEKRSKTGGKSDRRPAASASLVSAAANDRAAAADRAEKTAEAAKTSSLVPNDSKSDDDDSNDRPSSVEPEPTPAEPKVKIDIWKKRTTGHVLEEAIQRYLARKEAREQGLTP